MIEPQKNQEPGGTLFEKTVPLTREASTKAFY